MRTVLIIVGVWILINVLFVVLSEPPRKPRKHDAPPFSDAGYASVKINKEAYPYQEEEKISFMDIIMSVGVGAFFALAHPIAAALDAISCAFRGKPPTK
jgi:hypothetical protein